MKTAYNILERIHYEYDSLEPFPQISGTAVDATLRAMEEYAFLRTQQLQEFLQLRIKHSVAAIESGVGSQAYPFDEHTVEEIQGMKRAYGDVLIFMNSLPEPPKI